MILTTQNILLIGSFLLFISIIAGKSSYKFGVPTLIFFLITGMVAGSDGIGQIYFDNSSTTQFIGIIALNFILFSGGMDTEWKAIKPILWQGVSLSTIGVLLTATLTGLFISWATDFTLFEGLLLGSIVSSTDAATVFSVLRSKSLNLKYNLRPTLELESGSNDPMAYMLTLLFLGLVLNPDMPVADLVFKFGQQIALGVAGGFLFGKIAVWVINKITLGYDGLYSVLVIAIMLFTYSATDVVGGNGFLAVYLAALYFGNQKIAKKRNIANVFDGFAWLMQIILFLTLGLLVYPKDLLPIAGVGLLISAFMILIARPVSVFLSLSFFKVPIKSRLFTSWVGLRGAVPIVFATYPLIASADHPEISPQAQMIFNIVFFISITSILLQGTTLPFFAKWLKVSDPDTSVKKQQIDLELNAISEVLEIELSSEYGAIGKEISMLDFPAAARITMIKRDGETLIPDGSMTLRADDILIILCQNNKVVRHVYECLK